LCLKSFGQKSSENLERAAFQCYSSISIWALCVSFTLVHRLYCIRFEVLLAAIMKVIAFWDSLYGAISKKANFRTFTVDFLQEFGM
jgi:hypothetical protein